MHQLPEEALRRNRFSLSIQEIEECCSQFISSQFAADSAHDISHVKRVVDNAKFILNSESADPEVVISAAYLHDCIVLPKNHPKRASASELAAEKAVQFLKTNFFPAQKLKEVAHAIQAHSYSGKISAETIEAKIVQDADRLDALGAIGIARCFTVGGKLDRAIYNAEDPFCSTRNPDDLSFTIDHFYTKLFGLPELMHTESAKREAFKRVEVMKQFMDQLRQEID